MYGFLRNTNKISRFFANNCLHHSSYRINNNYYNQYILYGEEFIFYM